MRRFYLLLFTILMMATLSAYYDNTLEVRTDYPGVRVYLDGDYLGETSEFADINILSVDNIKPGRHKLKCIYMDYDPYEKTIIIPSEGTQSEEVSFGFKGVKYEDITKEGSGQQLKQTGTIIVRSKPTGATIYLNNSPMKGKNNELLLTDKKLHDIPIGPIKIKCSFSSSKQLADSFTLAAGDTVRVMADFFKDEISIDIDYRITIASEPAGMIYLDGKYKGKGNVNLKLEKGTYTVKIKREGYKELVKTIEVKNHDLFTYTLEENFAPLKIDTKPESGAKVYIDGEYYGLTPLYEPEIESGVHIIEIQKKGWLTVKDTITIIRNKKVEKSYLIQENVGKIKINAPGSIISINRSIVGRGEFEDKIEPGTYTVTALKEKHNDDTKTVMVKLGEEISIQLNPEPKTGKISISAESIHKKEKIKGLNIYKDGEDTGKTTFSALQLPIGDYMISVKHPEYIKKQKKITIEENKDLSLIFETEKYSWYEKKASLWKTQTWIGLGATALIAGGGLYCNSESNDYFDKYENTSITAEAMDYKQKTEDYESYRDYCYYAASGTIIYTFVSWIKASFYSKYADKK